MPSRSELAPKNFTGAAVPIAELVPAAMWKSNPEGVPWCVEKYPFPEGLTNLGSLKMFDVNPVAAKVELYRAFTASGISKAELGRRLDIPKTNVDRLFNFKNHTRLDQLEAAFAALGHHLEVSVRAA